LAVGHIHTYLVHPSKGHEIEPQLGGASVPLDGKLFRLLDDIYSRSDNECDIDISFNQSAYGTQRNPCRDLFVDYLHGPTLACGKLIAGGANQCRRPPLLRDHAPWAACGCSGGAAAVDALEWRERVFYLFNFFARDALSCKNQAKRQTHVFSFLLY
jgi:hypothetical protein